MKSMRILAVLAVCLLQTVAAQEKKLRVVTTLNYLKYVAAQVGGDRISVMALANPGQDPHYVTATPGMSQITHDANLFIENGLSLDVWAKNVIDASGNPNIQQGSPGHLIATINVPVKELPTEVSRAWGDIHPQGNPHVWLDPLNIKTIAENIVARLQKLDPSNAASYQKNLEQFKDRIDTAMFGDELLKAIGKKAGDILTRRVSNDELESWLKSKHLDSKLGGWMKKASSLNGLKIVTYHKTYIYFAERFGIQIISELEEKPGIPPPPQYRDAVVEQIKREGVKVILHDNFYSKDASTYVASKTPAKIIITYIDVGATEQVNTYEGLVSYLIESISQSGK